MHSPANFTNESSRRSPANPRKRAQRRYIPESECCTVQHRGGNTLPVQSRAAPPTSGEVLIVCHKMPASHASAAAVTTNGAGKYSQHHLGNGKVSESAAPRAYTGGTQDWDMCGSARFMREQLELRRPTSSSFLQLCTRKQVPFSAQNNHQ